jgi:hypothetical protein
MLGSIFGRGNNLWLIVLLVLFCLCGFDKRQ